MNKNDTSEMIAKSVMDQEGREPLVADSRPPVTPQDFSNCARTGKAYRFFKTINWGTMWDEFLNATQPNGSLKYTTAWSFAKGKAKSGWEAKVIYEAIGPRPEPVGENKLRVPWLGDWQLRRANGFWRSDDPVKMRFINALLKERADANEAARALAPFLILELAKLQRMEEKINFAFAGDPFIDREPPTSPRNQKRFWTFFEMHKQVTERMMAVMGQFIKVFGCSLEGDEYWLRLVEISKRLPKKTR